MNDPPRRSRTGHLPLCKGVGWNTGSQRATRWTAFVLLCIAFGPETASAQRFIRNYTVLQDSIPIVLEHARTASVLPPLNVHCFCLRVPDEVNGKVLVELLDVSPNGFANFQGFASQGRLRGCFHLGSIRVESGDIRYNDLPATHATLRRPLDDRFR